MPLQPTARVSLVDQAIEAITRLLAAGEWPVGHRIPPEPELAASLGVSRNTVREAVRALAHVGVLDVRRGDGTFVVATTEVEALLRRQAGRLAPGHLLEVRQSLDVRAAALAAERRTEADLAALDRLAAERRRAVAAGDRTGFVDADVAFHVAIVAATHNPLLIELYGGLAAAIRASIDAPVDDDEVLAEVYDPEHEAVLAAVRAGDALGAASAATVLLDHLAPG